MDITKKIATLIDVGNLGRAIAQVWDLRGLSRDLGIALAERIGKQKDMVVAAIAKEFTQFLRKIDIAKEMQKILEGMTLRINATIDLTRKERHGGAAGGQRISAAQKKARSQYKRP